MRVLTILAIALCAGACRDKPAPEVASVFQMGERAQAGPLIYTVVDTHTAVSLGSAANPRIPLNRFLLVRLSVVNSGGAASSIPTLTLVDDQGQSYQEAASGEGVPDWMGFVRKVSPAESTQGVILFDVPQKRFRLRVSDESDAKFAFVAIPLTLGEAPTVVPSGSAPAEK